MKFLFFDTETMGLPKNYKASYTDTDNWPQIVQLSWLLSEDQSLLKQSDNIVKVTIPIPEESSRIHGITNEIAAAKGRPIVEILGEFLNDVTEADVLVGHNLSFDLAVLQSELVRAQMNPELNKKMFCTMKSAVDYCQLPGRYGFKWPRLEELYSICFKEKLENAHNALVDVQATQRVFFKLIEDQVFSI